MEKTKVSKFYYLANEYRKTITDETEIERIDMTKEFYEELAHMIKEGEIIIINIIQTLGNAIDIQEEELKRMERIKKQYDHKG